MVTAMIVGIAGLGIYVVSQPDSPPFDEVMDSIDDSVPTEPLALVVQLAVLGLVLWAGAIAGSWAHGRPMRTLLAPARPFRWDMVGKVLILDATLRLALIGLSMVVPSSVDTSFTGFRIDHLWWLIPVVLATLLQTSGEDVLFKSFLLRQLGAVTRIFWVAPTLIILAFVAAHIGNPDLEQNLWLMLILFVVSDVVIVVLILRTGGMEAALVLHWTNNIMIFLLIAEQGTQANDLTLLVTEQLDQAPALVADLWGAAAYLLYLALLLTGLLWSGSPCCLGTPNWPALLEERDECHRSPPPPPPPSPPQPPPPSPPAFSAV